MFKFLVCILLFLTLSSFTPVYGINTQLNVSDGQVNEALANMPHVRFLPGNPLYCLIRAKEHFSRFFTDSAVERAEFDYMISSKRLNEIYKLYQQNRIDGVQSLVVSYKESTVKSLNQLSKARSQNQEIMPTVDEIVNGLSYQEVLLIKMSGESEANSAIDYFENYIDELEKLKPGVKGRFKLINAESSKANDVEEPSDKSSPTITIEPTASARPKRIIY